jgi:hypothetical protein
MQVDIDMHAFRVHDDCKIDIAHFKEGKRTLRRRDLRSANLVRDAWIERDASHSTFQNCFASNAAIHRSICMVPRVDNSIGDGP